MAVIVSVALIKPRESISRYTVQSLFEQNLVPDRIVLNISSQPYMLDEGFSSEPSWLESIRSPKIEVNWVENWGPYRKLLPVLKNITDNDLLITADDDVIYGC